MKTFFLASLLAALALAPVTVWALTRPTIPAVCLSSPKIWSI
jgi:hypothetical protein